MTQKDYIALAKCFSGARRFMKIKRQIVEENELLRMKQTYDVILQNVEAALWKDNAKFDTVKFRDYIEKHIDEI